MTTVQHTTFLAVYDDPGFQDLFDEYSDESSLNGMPRPDCQPGIYQRMEDAGLMHVIGAYSDGQLVGFLNLLVSMLPHYGQTVATTESYFVGAAHRKGGGGLMLLHEAERLAGELGAIGMLVSSPTGGRLADIVPKIGYQETNRIYFRSLQ